MLIVSPNLCLDITIRLPRLRPGSVARATGTDTSAGGKGINVARAARAVGAAPVVVGFLPADDGARLEFLLAREGLALRPIAVPGVLRVASILLEDDGRVTVVNGRGPDIDNAHWQRYLAVVAAELPRSDVLVCSGSLPPGVPRNAYQQLVDLGHQAGVPVVVDAAPRVLMCALGSGPDLVSPNLSEAEGLLFGRTDEDVNEEGADIVERALRAAIALHAAGAVRAVVTAGASGAALCTDVGSWWFTAPIVDLVNPVGAGDCFAAGAAHALAERTSDIDMVRRGMATASASCETSLMGRLDPARADGLFPTIAYERRDLTAERSDAGAEAR